MNDLIDTTEMYLRTIYELEEEGVTPLRARIAERLEQSGPTVSQTVARMERDGLVQVAGDRHLELTPEGRAKAVSVMRKHRLAELLLVNVIGLEWEHVHTEACRWEHVMSEAVEKKVFALLGEPSVSPYGNPIPGLEELRGGLTELPTRTPTPDEAGLSGSTSSPARAAARWSSAASPSTCSSTRPDGAPEVGRGAAGQRHRGRGHPAVRGRGERRPRRPALRGRPAGRARGARPRRLSPPPAPGSHRAVRQTRGMKLLVTGGAGYVGSACTAHLLAAGHEVTVLDDLSTGHRDAVPAGAAFVEGDVASAADGVLGADAFDGVLHFAARSLVGESVVDPAKYWHGNVVTSLALLDAVRAHRVPRLVFSSTAATYGEPETRADHRGRTGPPDQPLRRDASSRSTTRSPRYAAASGGGSAAVQPALLQRGGRPPPPTARCSASGTPPRPT